MVLRQAEPNCSAPKPECLPSVLRDVLAPATLADLKSSAGRLDWDLRQGCIASVSVHGLNGSARERAERVFRGHFRPQTAFMGYSSWRDNQGPSPAPAVVLKQVFGVPLHGFDTVI